MPSAENSDEEMWAELDEAQGPRRAEILLELADRSYNPDDMSQFATLVEAAAEAAQATDDHRMAAFARFNQAQGLMETDHPAEAIDHFLQAATYFTLLGDQDDIALCHHRAFESSRSGGTLEARPGIEPRYTALQADVYCSKSITY